MTTKLAEWASEHDQIIKSGLSCGHQEKFLPSAAGLTTIGFDLKVIWEMSVYAAAYDGMQRLMGFLTENCCQLDARGCSSDCPQPLLTRKKQKRTRQKVRAA